MYDLENIMELNHIYKRKLLNSFNKVFLKKYLDDLPLGIVKIFQTTYGSDDLRKMQIKPSYIKSIPNIQPILNIKQGSILIDFLLSLGAVKVLIEIIKVTILEDIKDVWKESDSSKAFRSILKDKICKSDILAIHNRKILG